MSSVQERARVGKVSASAECRGQGLHVVFRVLEAVVVPVLDTVSATLQAAPATALLALRELNAVLVNTE